MALFRKKYIHEAFLSHAVEDREIIATELYDRLDAAGVSMWYSGNSLKTGNDLEIEIESAIDDSRFGVVILTRTSTNRPWPLTEYNWLRKKESGNTKVVLPVLHDITFDEIKWPGIQWKYCLHTDCGLDFVVEKIVEEINTHREEEKARKKRELISVSVIAFALIALVSFIAYVIVNDRPSTLQIEDVVDNRIEKLINTIGNKYIAPFKLQSSSVSQGKIDSARLAYETYRSYYRNEYEFNDGLTLVRGRKNVSAALSQDPVDIANSPGYGMDSVDIYWSTPKITEGFHQSSFSFINKRPVTYTYEMQRDGSSYVVKVSYRNHIQYIHVTLSTPPQSSGTKRHEMSVLGLPPSESFVFERDKEDGDWHLLKVE